MKYTAEEVRAIAKRLHDGITVADSEALMASDMLTAYADLLERIAADEVAVPFAYYTVDDEGSATMLFFNRDEAMTYCDDDEQPGELFAHPPAQAAQVEESPMFAVSRSVHSYYTRDPEEARQAAFDGAQVREIIMGAPAAQPVAQPADSVRVTDGAPIVQQLRGRAAFLRDRGRIKSPEIMERAADALEAAPPINLAAVREVIESHINEAKKLRHDPESQDYLYEQADKLEAAIKGGA